MLLFEHKQYLQSYDAKSSMQTEISSFKIISLMPTKVACRDYNEILPGFVTSQTQINPCCAALEKRKSCCHAVKTRGAWKNLFIYESRFCLLMILMDSQVSKSMF